jgi:hypothetical protein
MVRDKNGEFKLGALTPEEQADFEVNARPAALRLSSTAVRAGAKTTKHDDELDPVGLDIVLAELFGEEIHLCDPKDKQVK